ncbi:putative tail fiber protein [Meiothermus phage MMP7]|nr:putative tail fiber protein [Meiothermus phage MMP7]
MPKTLNPQNTFPTNIPNFPISGNDEPMTIEPLENAIQAVLNRSENLHVRLSEAETQGVKRVRTVASLAALSAATGFNNGDVCDVEGYGRYRLYNPSALTADGLWVLTATGGGRWVHTLRDMRGNGLATLDSGGRLAQDVRDASILTQHIGNSQVTSAKLAPGAVVGHLGYTPLNKAGDNATGDITIQGYTIYRGRPDVNYNSDWNNFITPGIYRVMNQTGTAANAPQAYPYGILTVDRADVDALVQTYVPHLGGQAWARTRFNVNDWTAWFPLHHDHQNRFVVSAFAGQNIAVSGNSFTVLGRIFVTVPSGRSLYVRRVRAYFTGDFRARVATITGGVWVAWQTALDADINQSILAGPVSELVYVGADNVSGSSQTVQQGHGAMIELEIR